MKTMKAARFYSPHEPLKLEQVPMPSPGPGEALVQVKACGICGSDIHILEGDTLTGQTPVILGHEGSGVIAEVGSGVTDWREGDRVVIDSIVSCGYCRNCQRGRDSICLNRQVIGIHMDGALAQYVKVKARNLISLPAGIPFEQGCLATDAVATPYHALKARAKLRPAESVAVFGIGGLGSHAIQLARLMGAALIVAVDVSETALKRAKKAGADFVVDAREEDPPEAIRRLAGPLGVNMALECVGREQTVLWAAQSVEVGGRVAVVGLGPKRLQALAIAEFVRNEVNIMGSYAFELKEIAEVLALVDSGRLDLGSSVTKTISLEQVNEGLRELSESSGSVIRIVITRF